MQIIQLHIFFLHEPRQKNVVLSERIFHNTIIWLTDPVTEQFFLFIAKGICVRGHHNKYGLVHNLVINFND